MNLVVRFLMFISTMLIKFLNVEVDNDLINLFAVIVFVEIKVIVKKKNQVGRWEGKWEDHLFPFHMGEGKLKKISFLHTRGKGN